MEKLDKEKTLVKNFNSSNQFFSTKLIVALIIVIMAGVGTGYYLGQNGGSVNVDNVKNSISASTVKKGATEGSADSETFKDVTEGKLKEGGIEGEGAFHLERPGGESQNVYLTSSSVDLGKYVGRKIKVWGQTQKGQYAGWLMDAGKIEVLE